MKDDKNHPERKKFERWMKRYWGGVGLTWFTAADEYNSTQAQVGWEVWKRFTSQRRDGE